MGRPKKKPDEVLIPVATRIEQGVADDIEQIRAQLHVTRSKMLADLIDLGLGWYRKLNNRPKAVS